MAEFLVGVVVGGTLGYILTTKLPTLIKKLKKEL